MAVRRGLALWLPGVFALGCGLWVTSEPEYSGGYPPGSPLREQATLAPPVYAAAPDPNDAFAVAHDGSTRGARNASAEAAGPTSDPTTDLGEDVEDDGLDDQSRDEDDERSHYAGAGKAVTRPHPLAGLSASELRRRLERDPSSLGPMSVGAPNGGALINAIQLPEDPRWELVSPGAAWGTRETIDYLSDAVARVVEQYPDSLPLAIGHISDRDGGPIRPHRSHQSGADVDVGYYYKPDAHKWYQRATKDNLDLPRTWALVRALITETDVRLILIDHSIQAWLRDYAESVNEDRVWLDDIFGVKGSRRPALIRHAPGHATHLHVRFYNPIAEETARRCYADLVALGKVRVQPSSVNYKARKGDTLLALAKRFGTTVKAIKRANALRSNTILAKRVYKIPSSAKHSISMGPSQTVPPRRLPPTHPAFHSLSQR